MVKQVGTEPWEARRAPRRPKQRDLINDRKSMDPYFYWLVCSTNTVMDLICTASRKYIQCKLQVPLSVALVDYLSRSMHL